MFNPLGGRRRGADAIARHKEDRAAEIARAYFQRRLWRGLVEVPMDKDRCGATPGPKPTPPERLKDGRRRNRPR